jgi:hypothetical protein
LESAGDVLFVHLYRELALVEAQKAGEKIEPGRSGGNRLVWRSDAAPTMRNWPKLGIIFPAAIALLPRVALAGMPAPELTDIARLRFETLSFFLMILLASAGLIQLTWNLALRPTLTRLPRLNYWRALGLVFLWGLLFVIVLTMISGARELMTPGAWEHSGVTYKLKDVPK